jgi:phage terminase large subunit
VDRYRYGLGLRRSEKEGYNWFYLPGPAAIPMHASKLPNLLYGGAAGGMKSHSIRWDAYRHCFAIPGYRSILMRRTFEELKRNHLDKARSECERINAFLGSEVMNLITTEHELRINAHGKGKDSKIIFGHCQNLGDEEKYLGDEYDDFRPDEMGTFEKKQIVGVSGRVRTTKPGVTARVIGSSNPGGAFTLWIKRWFIDRNVPYDENPRYKKEKYGFIGAMLYDNPWLMDPDGTYTSYEDRLFAYDEDRRRQLLLGDWSALSGQFFPEFKAPSAGTIESHHVRILDIPPGCKIERWIDWGYDPHYGICLWAAVFPNGRLYVFYEYKFQRILAAQAAQNIKRYTFEDVLPVARARRVTKSVGDPSMWSSSGHTGESYAETFARNGVSMVQADNERVMGWGRLRHWFGDAPDGIPWMVFHPRCEVSIRTIPSLVRDKNDPDDVDTNGEDHASDCCRYGVMARPSPTVFRRSTPHPLPDTPAALLAMDIRPNTRPPGMVS